MGKYSYYCAFYRRGNRYPWRELAHIPVLLSNQQIHSDPSDNIMALTEPYMVGKQSLRLLHILVRVLV